MVIRCPDPSCGWAQHRVGLALSVPGFGVAPHQCEHTRCRRWMLVLVEVTALPEITCRVVGVRPRLGRTEPAVRRSLLAFPELATAEGRDSLRFLLVVGRLAGWIEPAGELPVMPRPTPTRRRRLRAQ